MKRKTSIASQEGQERMSDGQVAEVKGKVGAVLEKCGYSKKEGQRIIGRAGELSKGLRGLFDRLAQDWLEEILTKERECHRDFFGQRFSLKEFRETLEKYGPDKVKEWQELGLEPHFLPNVVMTPDAKFPGWKVKPEEWFWEQVSAGRIFQQQPNGEFVVVEEIRLPNKTVLIDIRLKPKYDGGKQMFENDNLLSPIIERLRRDDKIVRYEYEPQSSRFGVSANEWEECIKSELSKLLGLGVSQVRLERAIEANVVSQLYPDMPRYKDGKTDTWVLYEEHLAGRARRLRGGSSVCGGLVNVDYNYSAGDHWDYGAVRPLAVLD